MTRQRLGLLVIVLGAFVIFSGALDLALDLAFFPWARATPPLLGEWSGSLTTGNGVRLLVSLEMHRALTARGDICVRCSQIEGTATTCDAAGTVLRYRISGSPEDRQATRLHLGASPEREPPPEGLELDVLRGTWDGGDRLALEADFFWRRNGSAVSSTDDPATQPVPLPMRRAAASEFTAMCGRQSWRPRSADVLTRAARRHGSG
jgi:hypothetical protein